jgi:hypothetical protein
MRYIEVPGEIDRNNLLILYESLEQIKPQPVKIDIVFRDEDEKEDYREPTKAEILEGIAEGLRQAGSGEYLPIDQMWDEIKIKAW